MHSGKHITISDLSTGTLKSQESREWFISSPGSQQWLPKIVISKKKKKTLSFKADAEIGHFKESLTKRNSWPTCQHSKRCLEEFETQRKKKDSFNQWLHKRQKTREECILPITGKTGHSYRQERKNDNPTKQKMTNDFARITQIQ